MASNPSPETQEIKILEKAKADFKNFLAESFGNFVFEKDKLTALWNRKDIEKDLKDIWKLINTTNGKRLFWNSTSDEEEQEQSGLFEHKYPWLEDNELLNRLKFYKTKFEEINEEEEEIPGFTHRRIITREDLRTGEITYPSDDDFFRDLKETFRILITKVENIINSRIVIPKNKFLPVSYHENEAGVKKIKLSLKSNYDPGIYLTPDSDFSYTLAINFEETKPDCVLEFNSSLAEERISDNFWKEFSNDFLGNLNLLRDLFDPTKTKWLAFDQGDLITEETIQLKINFANLEEVFSETDPEGNKRLIYEKKLGELEVAYNTYTILNELFRKANLNFDKFRPDGTLIEPTNRSEPLPPQCGVKHYSLTDYWHHNSVHNPHWKNKDLNPWAEQDFGDQESGIIRSVCEVCQGAETHSDGCQTRQVDWMPTSLSPSSPFGTGGGAVDRFFSTPNQASPEFEAEQTRLAELKKAEFKKKEEAEKKAIAKMNKTFKDWEATWNQYLNSGTGIEIHETFKFKDREGIEQEWIDPFIVEIKKIEDIYHLGKEWTEDEEEEFSNFTTQKEMEEFHEKRSWIKIVLTKKPNVSEEDATRFKGKLLGSIGLGNYYCCENRSIYKTGSYPTKENEKGKYLILIEELLNDKNKASKDRKPIQLLFSESITPTDPKGSFLSGLNLIEEYFHIRAKEKVKRRSWDQYWHFRQQEYNEIEANMQPKLREKINTYKQEVERKEDINLLRKKNLFAKIDVLLGLRTETNLGYFDNFYDIKFPAERKTTTKLTIDKNFFQPIISELSKFKLLGEGKIVLRDFPNLQELVIEDMWLLEGKIIGTTKFVKLDISATAPKLKRLSLNNCKNLSELNLGEKMELNFLDIRFTDLKELDLSRTTIKSSGYGKNEILPIFDREDEDSISVVKPFGALTKTEIKFAEIDPELEKMFIDKETELKNFIQYPVGWKNEWSKKLCLAEEQKERVLEIYFEQWISKLAEKKDKKIYIKFKLERLAKEINNNPPRKMPDGTQTVEATTVLGILKNMIDPPTEQEIPKKSIQDWLKDKKITSEEAVDLSNSYNDHDKYTLEKIKQFLLTIKARKLAEWRERNSSAELTLQGWLDNGGITPHQFELLSNGYGIKAEVGLPNEWVKMSFDYLYTWEVLNEHLTLAEKYEREEREKAQLEAEIQRRMNDEKNWGDIHAEFGGEWGEDLKKDWVSCNFNFKACREWMHIGLGVRDAWFCAWLRDKKNFSSEEVLNHGDLEKLREEYESTLIYLE